MEWDFENKDLLELYQTGKSRKYPPAVIKKFAARILQIDAAVDIFNLTKTNSLHFQELRNKNRHSIRVDKKWRLEFRIEWEDRNKTKVYFIYLNYQTITVV
ncbi:MAG: type II toxin-antitoxin system RelE/ParE family toxin [Sedimentisphaeraceae bacterium JB056]